MPSSGAIRAGRAFVELFTKDGTLVRGLEAAKRRLQSWGASIAKAGIFSALSDSLKAGPLALATKYFADTGASLHKMSQASGASVESLSQLQYAADQCNVSFDAVAGAMNKLGSTAISAAQGNEEAMLALRALNLDAEKFLAMKPDERLRRVADAAARVGNVDVRRALLEKLVGNPDELMPLLAKGGRGMKQLQQQADDLGLTMSGRDAKAAEELRASWSLLWAAGARVAALLGGALAPMLRDAAEWLGQFVKRTTTWIDKNRPLIASIAKLTAISIGVAVAIAAVGAAVGALGTVLGVAAAAVTAVTAAIGFLFSPLGAIVALVAAGVVAWFKWTDAGKQAAADAGDTFEKMKADAGDAFGAIGTALKGGNIMAAVKVLWAFIQLEWARGVDLVMGVWEGFKSWFLGGLATMWAGAQALFANGWAAVESTWVDSTTFLANTFATAIVTMQNVFTRFQSWLRQTWTSLSGAIAKGLLWIASKSAKLLGFKDEAEQWAEAMSDVDRQTDHTNAGLRSEAQQALDDRNASAKNAMDERNRNRQDRLEQIERDRQGTLDEIARNAAGGGSGGAGSRAAGIAELEQAFAAAVAEANKVSAPERKRPESKSATQTKTARDEINKAGLLAERVSAVGTFNASRAGGLGGAPAVETARNTAQIVKELQEQKRYLKALKQGYAA